MKHKNHLLITLISTLTLLMVTPNYALGQKNYCKGSCDDKKFFGKIGCWIAKSWKQGYKKREDACFGKYDPANFDPNSPKVVFDASADNFDGLQAEIDDLANMLAANVTNTRYDLYLYQIFPKADNASFDNFDYWSSSLKKDDPGHHRTNKYFEAAAIAKYAAFVYLVGVIIVPNPDPTKPDLLMKYNDQVLSTMGIDGTAKLNEYRDRAKNILEHLKKSGKQDFRPAPTMMITYGHYRYKELIGFLSAYELLRMASTISNRNVGDLKASKLALQGTVRNLYQKTGANIEGASNNHTLQYAGAMGLAAIVLHDCGSGRWKKTWHPSKWAGKAHWHTENTLFENGDKSRMTEENAIAGYAEGPHYFCYGFESLFPFLMAYKNAVPENHTEKADAGVWRGELTVDNHDTKQKFHNLYDWYNQIQTPGDRAASYDATFIANLYPYFMKIANNGNHYVQSIKSYGVVGRQYEPDVIASKNLMKKKDSKYEPFFVNNKSGNIILQSPFGLADTNRVQIHLLAETGVAVNGGGHEHADANSIMVSAGNDMLIFDPGYEGYDYRDNFNDGCDHNVFSVNDKAMSSKKTRNATGVKENSLTHTDKTATAEARVFYKNTTVDRKVSYFNASNQQYLVSMDRTDEDDWWQANADFKMILSGNGNENDGTFEEVAGEDGMFRWTHPCSVRSNIAGTYNVQTYSALFAGIDGIDKITNEDEGVFGNLKNTATVNSNEDIANYACLSVNKKMSGDENQGVGIHTKVDILKQSDNQAHFLTVYWPYKCWQSPPVMKKKEDWNFALITIEDVGEEAWSEFVAMAKDGTVTIDDPAHRNPQEKLEFYASDMHLSIASVGYKNFKECKAITKFRLASINEGTLLKYNDTTYISASENITLGYDLAGKFKYAGYAKNDGAASSDVTLLLPDLEPFYDMIIKDASTNQEIPSTYDDQTREITFTVNPGENIQFISELANPCLLSCFFPETDTTIYYTFEFDEGTLETLGHHLDIVQDSGHLKITNGSKLFICEDNMLANKDSITMRGLPSGEPEEGYSLPNQSNPSNNEGGSSSGGVSGGSKSYGDRVGSKRAMIIVDDKAGLVLEKGSKTHIGEYSTIYLKEGGTLLVEDNVEVEIGGEGLGTGELIAEGGAHVCINNNSDLHFFVNEYDSTDKNVFYVAMGKAPNRSFSEVNLQGIKGKFYTDSIYDASNYYCLDFCDLKNFLLPYGINNRDFGWSNISEPKARMEMSDTFCENEAIIVDLKKSLNETRFYLKISAYDTLMNMEILGTEFFVPDTLVEGWDSSRATSVNLIDLYPLPFETGMHYIVDFGIENDCNEPDLVSNIFYIQAKPIAELSAPLSACPGFETFEADGAGSNFGTSYLWSVARNINLEQQHVDDPNSDEIEGVYIDTTGNGLVYSNMKFPDFHFKGGFKYDLSLSAFNVCGESVATKTIDIPLSANVTAQSDLIITGGFPNSSQLDGVITGTATFSWSPSNILDDPNILTPVATPNTSINIVLTATDGTCTESDTVYITVNQFANSGEDKTICNGNSVVIGSSLGALPPGYSILWSPSLGLNNPAIDQPLASPNTSTIYTMSILDASNNIIEEDEVSVTILDSLTSGFSIEQTDLFEFSFINFTTVPSQLNTYAWSFGNGSTSSLINPNHTFVDYQKDTIYEICLVASNLCASDTFCDSLRIDSIGTAGSTSMIAITQSSFFITDLDDRLTQAESLKINSEKVNVPASITVRPNPFIRKTEIVINHDMSTYTQAAVVLYDFGGREILNYSLDKIEKTVKVDLSGKRHGTYYARLIADGHVLETVKLTLID